MYDLKSKQKSISLLALSFGLVSTFSISAAIPQMRVYYSRYSAVQVDLLVSIPSFAIILVMLANVVLAGYLGERQVILSGLVLYTIAGTLPLFYQAYPFVLVSRFFMGIGSGMVNTQAVSAISRRYTGQDRSRLLGYRGSVEALGNAVLTMAAGVLLISSWTRVFWIYTVGLLILAVYLLGFPGKRGESDTLDRFADKKNIREEKGSGAEVPVNKEGGPAGSSEDKHFLQNLAAAGLCFLCIGSNTVLTMRIPVIMTGRQIGTDVQASMLLSGMIISSIFAGIFYGPLKKRLKDRFLVVMLLLSIAGMMGVCLSGAAFPMALSALVFGASYSIVVTEMFEYIAEILPERQINRGTTVILTGCNLGAFCATYIMKMVSLLAPGPKAPVYFYSAAFLLIICLLLFKKQQNRRNL